MSDFRWPTEGVPLASTRRRAVELAQRVGAKLEDWEEDGLGPASGFALLTPAGRVVQVRELAHQVEQGWAGAGLDVDAADLLDLGVEALLTEVMDLFGLAAADLIWRVTETSELRDATARLVELARAAKAFPRPAR